MTRDHAAGFAQLLALEGRSFNDAVVVSGIDARQLRNGLDRGILNIGEKLRVGRWAFTGRDLLELMIVDRLTTRAWVPVGQAATAAKIIAANAEKLFDAMLTNASGEEASSKIIEVIVCRDDDGPRVVFHQRGAKWGFYDTSWLQLPEIRFDEAHVRLPAIGMLTDFLAGTQLVLDADV